MGLFAEFSSQVLGAVMQTGSVVLGVKLAIKDVDAQVFLAFHCAKLKTKLSPTAYLMYNQISRY
jgi:hypothetical protein